MSATHHPEGQEPKPINANTALAEMRAALHLALSHLADASDAHLRALLAVNSTKDVIESALLRTAGASATPQEGA